MKKFLLKALDINPEEWGAVSFLLTISFFLGIFLVTFDVGTSTLFLDESINPVTHEIRGWGQKYLSLAFILAGLLGIFASYIFVTLQKKISFHHLVKVTMVVMSLYVLGLAFVLEATHNRYVIYLSFASLGPLNALGLLCYYGVVSRSFNVKNQKRLTGTVDQGQMFATAIAFFTVPLIQNLPFFTDEIHFLFISFVGIGAALLLLNIYFNKYRTNELRANVKEKEEQHINFIEMSQNPYIRVLCMLFLFSVLATFFVELSFLSVAADQYKLKGSESLASFLAYYGGILTVFSLILQVFIGDRIIETYGIKVALLILPILLAVITLLSALVGTFMGYEVETAGTTAVYFFIFIALSKFFLQSAKESFEEPIFKNFFLPIDTKVRHDVQVKVEGVFQQFSVFIAGILLTAAGIFHFFELIHYSYLLVFIFIGYAYTVIKIHKEYQTTLQKTLASRKGTESSDIKVKYSFTETLQGELKSKEHERVIFSLKLMEKMEPLKFESLLAGLAHDENQEIRKYAIERIKKRKVLAAVPSIKRISEIEKSPLIKKLALEALENINKTESIAASETKLALMVRSKNPEDREYAAKILSKSNNDESTIHLLVLMRDTDPKVKMAAIISAANCKNSELWTILIEHLSSSVYGNASAGVLASYGEDIMHTLETAFHKTGQDVQTQLRIVQILGSIGGVKAIELLWNKIDFPDKKIRTQVLLSLSNCSFKVDSEKLVKIKQTLEIAIGNAAWNMAALSEIESGDEYALIREAIEEEIRLDNDYIFLLLSFIYDSQAINLVKENLESGTVEGHLYGLELLDVFLGDDIQPWLFPLFEDISQSDRNEKLQTYFPRESLNSTEVLIHIINRDYNSINRWTKVCAIYSLSKMPEYKISDDLIANLFNPDPLLRETAAWVIYNLDKKIYNECSKRVATSVKKELDEKLVASSGELKINRITQVKRTKAFAAVPGVILTDLIELTEVETFDSGETLIPKGENGNSPLYLLMSGKVGLLEEEKTMPALYENELLGEMLLLDTDINDVSVVALESTRTFKIEKNRLLELMINNYRFTREYLKIISSRWTATVQVETNS